MQELVEVEVQVAMVPLILEQDGEIVVRVVLSPVAIGLVLLV